MVGVVCWDFGKEVLIKFIVGRGRFGFPLEGVGRAIMCAAQKKVFVTEVKNCMQIHTQF